MRGHLKLPSPAMAVALTALFVSLGGVGYAASTIGTKQIKNGAVTTKKLHKHGVTTKKLAYHAVITNKLADHAVKTNKLAGNAVKTNKLAGSAVTTNKLADHAVTTDKLAGNAVTTDKLAGNAVTTNRLADNAVTGQKVQDNSLTGRDINESTLAQVPDSAKFDGHGPGAFVSSSVSRHESPIEAGTLLGDGTRYIDEACPPGDILLAGGPDNVAANSVLLESFPMPGSTTSWRVRIKPQTGGDPFSVAVLCAR